jgi:hypothetical protein
MQFTVAAKSLADSIKLMSSIVPTGTNSVFALDLRDGDLWLYGNSETITFKCKCKDVKEVSGKGLVGIELSRLEKLVRGRKEFTVSLKENVLGFENKKDKIKADITIIPVTRDTINGFDDSLELKKGDKKHKIEPDLFSAILDGLAKTKINAVHVSDPLDTFIVLKDNVLEVSSSDNFHLAFYSAQCESEVSLRLGASKAVFDVLAKLAIAFPNKVQLAFNTSAIIASCADYALNMPTIQTTDASFLRTKSFISELPKAKASFEMSVTEFSSSLDNVSSVYDEGGSVLKMSLKQTKKGYSLYLDMSTTYGTVSSAVDANAVKGAEFVCTCDPRMILDILTLVKAKKFKFSYISEKACIFTVTLDNLVTTYISSTVSE